MCWCRMGEGETGGGGGIWPLLSGLKRNSGPEFNKC